MFDERHVKTTCRAFTNRRGIGVSERAQRLIHQLINSVHLDRHETWRLTDQMVVKYDYQWTTWLERVLPAIAESHHIVHQITLIDVVVWAGRNLHAFDMGPLNCPFPGREERPNDPCMGQIPFPWQDPPEMR